LLLDPNILLPAKWGGYNKHSADFHSTLHKTGQPSTQGKEGKHPDWSTTRSQATPAQEQANNNQRRPLGDTNRIPQETGVRTESSTCLVRGGDQPQRLGNQPGPGIKLEWRITSWVKRRGSVLQSRMQRWPYG
jgi:hypothetical protein